jgi:peptidoglycan/xylan/chitin deacetylase (PgdA/CDA1 family)
MHQVESYETPPFRIGIMPMEGESEDEYIAAFKADFERSAAQIENITGSRPFVFSYPYGRSTNLSEQLLRDCGVKVTLTIKKGANYVKRDNPDSLFGMKRYNVSGNMTAAELLAMIR